MIARSTIHINHQTNKNPNDSKFNSNKIAIRDFSGGRLPEKGKLSRFLVGAGISASMLMGKTKYVLVALKLTKAAPLVSMVISSLAYSLVFGLPYAVGMVGLIFVHECGHAVVMNHYKIPFSPMVFIPFMGAVIATKERPRNSYEDAMIAFGGPVAGSLGALGVAALGAATDSQLLYALADFGYMINLFNLLPIGMMDGGRIGNAVSPWFGVAGLGLGGALLMHGMVSNPIFYLIMLGGTWSTASRFFGWGEEQEGEGAGSDKDYYKIRGQDQAKILAAYGALIAALLLAMRDNNKSRKTPKQLQQQQEEYSSDYHSDLEWSELKGKQGGAVYDDYFANVTVESSDDHRRRD